jgi:methionyl-tRNA formyltransferase
LILDYSSHLITLAVNQPLHPLRIIFMGTPDFAVPSLSALLDHGRSIVGVVTAPDKPRGRGRQLSPTPVKELARAHGLNLLQPESLKDPAFASAIRLLQPDLIVVVAFRILPPAIFAIPRLGAFNLHASLLPRYRGAAPINWAIINGETETGVTTFVLQEKVDTGGILLQRGIPILPGDDAGSVHDRLAQLGAGMVLDTVRLIAEGNTQPKMQDDTLATPAPRIFRDDCRIFWDRPAREIANRIRGLSPHPTAFSTHNGKVIKIFRAAVLPDRVDRPPGTLVVTTDHLAVATGEGLLSLVDLQVEGKTRMGVAEFLRGYAMADGERLGEEAASRNTGMQE